MRLNKFAVVAVVVILAIAAFIARTSLYTSNPAPEGVMCTQEALMCPDGSYVGRSGPTCAFTACPNQAYVEGVLKQDPSGFALIMSAPISSPQEVSYRMPLVVKVTNAIGQLVGRKVRAYGTFTEGATFTVDHLESLPGDAGDPTRGDVAVGKTVYVNGVRITLNSIVQDSRCPLEVQCIRAGDVTVNVTLQSDTDKETKDMVSTETVGFDSFKISIENVTPARVRDTTPVPGSYVVTFAVRSTRY